MICWLLGLVLGCSGENGESVVAWRGRVAEMTEREEGRLWAEMEEMALGVKVCGSGVFGWLVGGSSRQREKAGGWSPVWRGRVGLLVYVSGWCFV